MQTVGLFAGRGDVVLAMVLALVLGGIIGWKLKALQVSLAKRFSTKKG
jgi:hypothetical protein